MAFEIDKLQQYLKGIKTQITQVWWGTIVIEIKRGVPTRIIEQKSIILDDDEKTLES